MHTLVCGEPEEWEGNISLCSWSHWDNLWQTPVGGSRPGVDSVHIN